MAFLPVRRVGKKKKEEDKDPFINVTGVPRIKDKGARNEIRRYFASLQRKENRDKY